MNWTRLGEIGVQLFRRRVQTAKPIFMINTSIEALRKPQVPIGVLFIPNPI